MLSNFMIVGRVAADPKISLTDDFDEAVISVMVRTPFPNEEGLEDEECVDISLWRGIADECRDLLKEGSLVAVKGRIGGYKKDAEDERHMPRLIGEKVSYL